MSEIIPVTETPKDPNLPPAITDIPPLDTIAKLRVNQRPHTRLLFREQVLEDLTGLQKIELYKRFAETVTTFTERAIETTDQSSSGETYLPIAMLKQNVLFSFKSDNGIFVNEQLL